MLNGGDEFKGCVYCNFMTGAQVYHYLWTSRQMIRVRDRRKYFRVSVMNRGERHAAPSPRPTPGKEQQLSVHIVWAGQEENVPLSKSNR